MEEDFEVPVVVRRTGTPADLLSLDELPTIAVHR